ncbi:MAG: methyltransferase domain-containing protein [Spirochaetes bacterium]|nr:methyltransferase domain-containing protein [Spirochaetota bacterium]
MVEILLVPSVRRGNGSGHLVRCFSLARALGNTAALFLADDPGEGYWSADELRLAYPREMGAVRVIGELRSEARFRLVVLDRRETSATELARWSARGAVVAIDEGGEARPRASYLIDILPRARRAARVGSPPNIASLGFLSLPEARREPPQAIRRVLVSFGGEDPRRLAESFLEAAIGGGILSPEQVTVVTGALSRSESRFPGVTAIGPVQDLKEMLRSYDLVVTQFGLTAFEAAWAGCAVLLLNPSDAHEELSRAAGFYSLGISAPSRKVLGSMLAEPGGMIEATARAAPRERLDLAARIDSLTPRNSGECPCCGRPDGVAVYRNERKTYLACPDCGLVRMAHFHPRENPYAERAYFFEEYKAQYGRTYIEDIPSIRLSAAKRLGVIESLLPAGHEGQCILDVGCADGAFVAEAQARGWDPVGSDLSPDAVEYVRDSFGVPAFVGDFSEPGADGLYPRNAACLSMWYVIEHFEELGRILRRAASLLRPGGVFAFSTPSGSGISARKDPGAFYERSPDDHFTVWSPKTAPGILKRFGFEVQRIVVTGHHPERFPGVPADPRTLRYKAAMAASRLCGLGDTFECYAVYTGRPGSV